MLKPVSRKSALPFHLTWFVDNMTDTPFDPETLRAALAGKSPRVILKAALERFERIAVSFSGAEDVALVDMAAHMRPGIRVFTLDTGRLHPETYRFIEKVRERYDIALEVLAPERQALERLVNEKGLFSFYRDGHEECCAIRKVAPLRRVLASLDAWITGQRRDQNPTRTELAEFEADLAFSAPGKALYKFNPLANWTSAQVWDYIEAYDAPYNELHARGYISIGCEPCTRPVLPNQHERAGRWWWEDAAKKECGLHKGNLAKGSEAGRPSP
jgi:phosphoadenosine phosphosulfate reductase